MKLLVDECLSQRVAQLLTSNGHDAVQVGDPALLGHTDDEVMACAAQEARIVISADTDFGVLLARSNATLPSVVLIRRQLHDPDDQAAVIAHVLDVQRTTSPPAPSWSSPIPGSASGRCP